MSISIYCHSSYFVATVPCQEMQGGYPYTWYLINTWAKKDFQIVFGKSENTNKKYHQTYIKPKKNGDLYFDDKVSDHTISLVLFYLFYLVE